MERDNKLIKSILRYGSKEAADQLVRAYYDEIYRFVHRQTGNPEDSLDLTQEIIIAALQSLPSFNYRKAGFRTWLYRIASNKVVDARRKVTPVTVPLDEEYAEDDFVFGVMNRDTLNRIEEYLCTLDPELQTVVRLRVFAEYSFPEIAQASGQAEEKVKAQYYRLVKKLKKEFEYDE